MVLPVTDPPEVDLPRTQVGANPQNLVAGLFVDYWFRPEEPLPSAALVALLGEFGVSAAGARAAIARVARRGVLQLSRRGRRTYYTMTAGAARALEQPQRRMMEFGSGKGDWDGIWTTVIYSVPEDQRELRYTLRRRLRFLGYGPMYDGVWVSPRADHQQTVELLGSVDVRNATVLRGEVTYSANGGDPLTAWDLDTIEMAYRQFLTEFGPLGDRVAQGLVGPAEALVARTTIKELWLEVVSSDPELPDNLLPADWPGAAGRRLFAGVYDGLGPIAEARVRQLLAQHDPDLVPRTGHRTTAEAWD